MDVIHQDGFMDWHTHVVREMKRTQTAPSVYVNLNQQHLCFANENRSAHSFLWSGDPIFLCELTENDHISGIWRLVHCDNSLPEERGNVRGEYRYPPSREQIEGTVIA